MTTDARHTPEQKPRVGYAAVYAALYPEMADIMRRHGYALAVHGSMRRDFDVVAVPWVDAPSLPKVVVAELVRTFDMKAVGEPGAKPHGRIAYTLSIGFGECFADLSFMPTLYGNSEHVAWLCYDRHENGNVTIKTCNSDAKGAFRVYRGTPTAALADGGLAETVRLLEECRAMAVECVPYNKDFLSRIDAALARLKGE